MAVETIIICNKYRRLYKYKRALFIDVYACFYKYKRACTYINQKLTAQ